MAFLEDLKKKMSTPGADRYSEERFRAAKPQIVEQEGSSQTSDTTPPFLLNIEEEARKKRRFIYTIVAIVVAVVLVAGGTFWGVSAYRAAYVVSENSVGVEIKAPSSVPSGDDAEFTVKVKNNSKVVWQNVLLETQSPEGLAIALTEPKAAGTDTLQWSMGTLRPNESSSVRVKGRLVGEPNSNAKINTVTSFIPENATDKKIQKKQFAAIHVDDSPIQINIIAPKQAASGERMQVKVIYENHKAQDVNGVRITVAPPQGFSVEQTTPATAGNQLAWDFPVLTQKSQGEITFYGTLQGDPEIVRTFKATLGFVTKENKFLFQKTVQATTAIARRAITLTQVFNNSQDTLKVNPSDKVEAKILVKNTGDIGLRDLIIKTAFSGTGINAATFESEGGFYDSRLNTISWSAASIPALKAMRPGDVAELKFRFNILDAQNLPLIKEQDKNFSIFAQTSADSPDIPTPIGASKVITSGRFQVMLNSVLRVEMAAYYDDGRTGLPVGVGPLPPQVGRETIYTVRARVKNTSNDIVDGMYRAVLPEGMRWIDNKYTTTGTVTYDERTREIKWSLPIIAARVGTGAPAPEFSFQVGLTPSINQIGSRPVLCLGSSLDGTDTFTAARLHAVGDAVTTEDVDPERSEVVR